MSTLTRPQFQPLLGGIFLHYFSQEVDGGEKKNIYIYIKREQSNIPEQLLPKRAKAHTKVRRVAI